MGTVIRFPDERRSGCNLGGHAPAAPCAVVILPVIRVERHIDDTPDGFAPDADRPRGGGRRSRGRGS